ncbi:Ig-like domain-containing protein [Exiguobacterium sp. BMC-KP]|uniref:Ig-like domain-containing protein n=1 Tax=Exiguobacterium sp. BMC-KP TaxID=1684312 RepID=UPI0006AA19D0|nr:Ig-like domain-containing protein [Exiguobacterium sp. BMC-KP]
MGTKKSNKLYAAAAALAVTASAVAPGLTADAASKVTVKSVTNPASISHYGGYTFAVKKLSLPKTVKVLLSNKKYENRSVKWGKVSYDKKYIGKYQTISGTVSGTTKKASIKVKLNNYPVDVVEPKLAPVAVGEKLNLPSTIDVKYKDGKVIARSAKSFNLTAEKTDKAGMMKLSYNYMGKNSSIKGSIAYEVKAAEITNVMNEIKDDMLSVSADVKYPAKDAKVEVLVYAFKDMTKEPIKVAAELKDGKLTAKSGVLPAGTHAFAVQVGDVVSPAKDFVIEAPMVKEVKAINAQTVEVHFNKAIDAKTLKVDNEDLIKVEAGSGAVETGAIKQELSTDGMTLTLTTANTKIFKGDYTVKVPFEMIKDVKGTFVKPINAKVSVDDKVAPALVKATTLVKDVKDGIKSVVVTFDENVKSVDTIKIDGLNYNVVLDGKEATITFAQPLDASKKYDVTVINATDFAGNIKDVQVAPLSVSVDNVSPEVSSVVAISEDKLKLTLSKKVDIAELKKSSMLSATVGTFATSIIESVDAGEKDGEYIITLNDQYLFKTGNSDVVTLKFAEKALVDSLGNTNLVKIEKTATVTKDATAPAVSKVEEVKDKDGKVTGFALTYTEDVKGQSLTGLKVVNAKGEILAVNDVVNAPTIDEEDSKKVVFSFKANVVSSKYTFELPEGFVTDNALVANKSAKYGFSVTINDIVPPAQTSFAIVSATNVENKVNTLAVDFGTKVAVVGDGSALNPSAYTINGVTLPADTKITLAGNVGDNGYQTKVEIELPKGFVKANDAKAGFRITGVKSLDGKTSESKFVTVDIKDNTAPELKSIVATDLTKLTLSYSEAVKVMPNIPAVPEENVDPAAAIADELKLLDSKGNVVTFSDYTVTEDGKIVLTVTDATAVKSVSTVKLGENGVANIFDANNVAQKEEITVSK